MANSEETKIQAQARAVAMEKTWDSSFQEQVAAAAYNTAPVEILVRTLAHHLRPRVKPEDYRRLSFLEVGCGAGPNLIWLAERGIRASGVDISTTALDLARRHFKERHLESQLENLSHGSATALPHADASFDGVIESCVFQHLARADRIQAFAEVVRVLKPGGVFVGHMLSRRHSTYGSLHARELSDDPGTILLQSDKVSNKFHLETIGLSHFFAAAEFSTLLAGCAMVDPLEATYELSREESKRRGYDRYLQAMWVVYAIK
ncbi:MAG: class I SAM-dependent methyltransferase [Alphaproteobacteria bacterium]|nr:class I SAM-dependent methyltransferase [Alphaproteobacteria bacterium]